MTLLAAAAGFSPTEPDAPWPPNYDWTPEPVIHPLSAPWNATTYAITPTPDGTGSVVHPSVIDFATLLGRDWNGWRYWMAVTGYYNTNDREENPCILVSQDGQTWQVPAGLTNPVYPAPSEPQYNSDPDLVYDPITDELVLCYRGGDLLPRIARSPDGVTWPAVAARVSIGYDKELLSPSLIRRGSSHWQMYAVAAEPRRVQVWNSPDLLNWTGPIETNGITGMSSTPWHIGVTRHRGTYYALVNTYIPSGLYAATSADGLTWTLNPTPVLTGLYGWDDRWMYRATLQPHEDGQRFRVWYSAQGNSSWRAGYTQIPLTEWPAI